MNKNNAIEVHNLSKSFRIYHERKTTLYEHLVGIFARKKNYEDLKVLDSISFSVKKGEMLGIIGRNGEGKTTLLRILTKIIKPSGGYVETDGSMAPFLELGAGFQPELNAIENIIQYGIFLGFTKKEIKSKVPTILEYAELERFADTKLKNFSSGMYARLAFSTAIQVDPEILIVDEVLSVGDVAFQEKCFKTFSSFKKQGKTIVFVTHNLSQITKLCDRAILLNNGKLNMVGKPHDVVNAFYRVIEKKMQAKDGQFVPLERHCGPHSFYINSNTNISYLANLAADFVSIINTKNNKIIKNIPVAASPRELMVDQTGKFLYVVNRDADCLSVIDTNLNEVITNILVGERPRGIAMDSLSNKIYVANRDSQSISVIDGRNNQVLTSILTRGQPQGMSFNSSTMKLYATLSDHDNVLVIKDDSIINEIPVGKFPCSVTINEKNNSVYIVNRDSNYVTVIDGLSDKIIQNIIVQKNPFGISIDWERNYLYVCNSGSNTLSKIDGKTNEVIATIKVGNFPLGVGIDQKLNKVYVANEAEDSISVIDGKSNVILETMDLRKIMENQ